MLGQTTDCLLLARPTSAALTGDGSRPCKRQTPEGHLAWRQLPQAHRTTAQAALRILTMPPERPPQRRKPLELLHATLHDGAELGDDLHVGL